MNKEKIVFLAAQKDAKINNPQDQDIIAWVRMGTVIQLLNFRMEP